MLKKIFVSSMIALFVLTLLPISASAMNSALQPGTIIKGSSSSVYYYGADNKRYVFPTENTYKTWFISFNVVVTIGNEVLGGIPIGGNVTYKPGVKLVKITTDPKVYYVDKEGTLRWVTSESLAKNLWGSSWAKLIDDVPDPFFVNYKIGAPLENPDVTAVPTAYSINQDKLISDEPDPTSDEISKISLNGSVSGSSANLTWETVSVNAPNGFKVVWSNQINPVYPGNEYHYLSDTNVRSDSWEGLSSGTYYFRVCQYVDGKCGIYSNNLMLKVSGTTTNETKYLKLSAEMFDNNVAKLTWTTNFTSSQGYKTVISENPNPVYPGNEYHYLTDPNVRTDLWSGESGKTYHFRVCEYLGGKCGVYSNDVAITISGESAEMLTNKITLNGYYDESNNQVVITWQSNSNILNGIKIVKSTQINPVYPGNDYHFLEGQYVMNEFSQDPPGGTDIWKNLTADTYHFRACEYLDGKCGIYSNDIEITVPNTVTETSTGSISLSGNVNSGTVYLNWILSDMTSAQGFKVVYSETANPVYPGNEYHYLTDPNIRTNTWEGLSAGTYHFRVCEYLGGSCGVYSNDLTLTVQ